MTWSVFRWVWRLEAPLFVGMPPAGALNRCRPYVPARALWGAGTAEMARSTSGENFPDYKSVGDEIKQNCRFTYLFPAEKRDGRFLAWLPKFEGTQGLRWRLQDSGKSLSDRDFRRRLLDSRPGTAIAPESDSALEGSLRHTECINPWWCDSNRQGETAAPVLLLGYVFWKDSALHRQFQDIETLFIGGDTRYGLGKIRRIDWEGPSSNSVVFGKQVRLDREHPEVESDVVLGHAPEDDKTDMQGAKELLGGWDRGSPWKEGVAWAPGSSLYSTNEDDDESSSQSENGIKMVHWSINSRGYWIHQGDK